MPLPVNPLSPQVSALRAQLGQMPALGAPSASLSDFLLSGRSALSDQNVQQEAEQPSAWSQGRADAASAHALAAQALQDRVNETAGGPADYSRTQALASMGPGGKHYGLGTLLTDPLHTIEYGAGQAEKQLELQGMGGAIGGVGGAALGGLLLRNPVAGFKAGFKAGAFLQPMLDAAGNNVASQQADPAQASKPLAARNLSSGISGLVQGAAHYLVPESAIENTSLGTLGKQVIDNATGKTKAASGVLNGGVQALLSGAGKGALYSALGTGADQMAQTNLAGQSRYDAGAIADSATLGGIGGAAMHIPAAGIGAVAGGINKGVDLTKAGAGKVIDTAGKVSDKLQSGDVVDSATAAGESLGGKAAGAAGVAGNVLSGGVKAASSFASGFASRFTDPASSWLGAQLDRVSKAPVDDDTTVGQLTSQWRDNLSSTAIGKGFKGMMELYRTGKQDPVQSIADGTAAIAGHLKQALDADPSKAAPVLSALIGTGGGAAYERAKSAVSDWISSGGTALAAHILGPELERNVSRMNPMSADADPEYMARMQDATMASRASMPFDGATTLRQMVDGGDHIGANIYDRIRGGYAYVDGDIQHFVLTAAATLSSAGSDEVRTKWQTALAGKLRDAYTDRYGDSMGAVLSAATMNTVNALVGGKPSHEEVAQAMSNLSKVGAGAEAVYSKANAKVKAADVEGHMAMGEGEGIGDLASMVAQADQHAAGEQAPAEQAEQAPAEQAPAEQAPAEHAEQAPAAAEQEAAPTADQIHALGQLAGLSPEAMEDRAHLARMMSAPDVNGMNPHEAAATAANHYNELMATTAHLAGRQPTDVTDALGIIKAHHEALSEASQPPATRAETVQAAENAKAAARPARNTSKRKDVADSVITPRWAGDLIDRYSVHEGLSAKSIARLLQVNRDMRRINGAPLGHKEAVQALTAIGRWLHGDHAYSHITGAQVDAALKAQFGKNAGTVWAILRQHLGFNEAGAQGEQAGAAHFDANPTVNPDAAKRMAVVERKVHYGDDGLPMSYQEANKKGAELGWGGGSKERTPLTADTNHRTQDDVPAESLADEHGYMTSALRALQDEHPVRDAAYQNRVKSTARALRERFADDAEERGLTPDEQDQEARVRNVHPSMSDEDVLSKHYVMVTGNEHHSDTGLSLRELNKLKATSRAAGQNITLNTYNVGTRDMGEGTSQTSKKLAINPVHLTAAFMKRAAANGSFDSSRRGVLNAFHDGLVSLMNDPRTRSEMPLSDSQNSGVWLDKDGRININPKMVIHIDNGKPVTYGDLTPGASAKERMAQLNEAVEKARTHLQDAGLPPAGVAMHDAEQSHKGASEGLKSLSETSAEALGFDPGDAKKYQAVQTRLESDQRLMKRANRIIAEPAGDGSLVSKYAGAVGDESKQKFTSADHVAVLLDRGQDINKNEALRSQVDRAITAGAKIVTSPGRVRVNAGREAERALSKYMAERNYADTGSGVWHQTGDAIAAQASNVRGEAGAKYAALSHYRNLTKRASEAGVPLDKLAAGMHPDQLEGRQSVLATEWLKAREAAQRLEGRERSSGYGRDSATPQYIEDQIDGKARGEGERNYDDNGTALGWASNRQPWTEHDQWAHDTARSLLGAMSKGVSGDDLDRRFTEAVSDHDKGPWESYHRVTAMQRQLAGATGEEQAWLRDRAGRYARGLHAAAQNKEAEAYHAVADDLHLNQGIDNAVAREATASMFEAARLDGNKGVSRLVPALLRAYRSGNVSDSLRDVVGDHFPENGDESPEAMELRRQYALAAHHLDTYRRYIGENAVLGVPRWEPDDWSTRIQAGEAPARHSSDVRGPSAQGGQEDHGNFPGGASERKLSAASRPFIDSDKPISENVASVRKYVLDRTGIVPEFHSLHELGHNGDYLDNVIRLAHEAPMSTGAHEAMHAILDQMVKHGGDKGKEMVNLLNRVASSDHVLGQIKELAKAAGRSGVLKNLEGEHGQEERIAYMYQLHSLGMLDMKEPRAKSFFGRIAQAIKRILKVTTDHGVAEQLMDHIHQGRFSPGTDPHPVSAMYDAVMKKRAPGYIQNLQRGYDQVSHYVDRLQSPAGQTLRESGYDKLSEIGRLFAPAPGDGQAGWIEAHRAQSAQWINRYADLTGDLSDHERDTLHTYAQQMDRDGSASFKAPQSVLTAYSGMRKLLDEVHGYLNDKGLQRLDAEGNPVGVGYRDNYFPAVYDEKAMSQDMAGLTEALKRSGMDDSTARDTALKMANGQHASPDEYGVGYNPYFSNHAERTLNIPHKDIAPFLSKNLDKVMVNYLTQAAKRGEYVQRFGNGGEKIRQALENARSLGASDRDVENFENSIRKLEGTAHKNVDPRWKKAMGPLLAGVNAVTLPAALLTNLGDAIDIGLRSNSAGNSFKALHYGLRNLWRGMKNNGENPDALHKLAMEFGTMTNKRLEETVSGYNDQPDGIGRKMNNLLFRANGVDPWTRNMHAYATDTALNFIQDHIGKYNESATSKRFMNDLGLRPGDVEMKDGQLVRDAKNAKLRDAVNKFVHQSAIKPSEGDTPNWFGDPRLAVFSHLKQFGYAFDQQVRHWALHEKDAGNWKPAMMMATHVPAMMTTMYLRALALHGGVLPRTMANWDLKDWIGEAMFRSGMWGERFGQVADLNHPAFLAGPTATMAYKGIGDAFDNWTK